MTDEQRGQAIVRVAKVLYEHDGGEESYLRMAEAALESVGYFALVDVAEAADKLLVVIGEDTGFRCGFAVAGELHDRQMTLIHALAKVQP
jgi:photosystem II stability/assembly factor-like uncharacterized protein